MVKEFKSNIVLFKKGDYATIDGQMVEIIDLRHENGFIMFKVKLMKFKNKLTNWVYQANLSPIINQNNARILFGKSI